MQKLGFFSKPVVFSGKENKIQNHLKRLFKITSPFIHSLPFLTLIIFPGNYIRGGLSLCTR